MRAVDNLEPPEDAGDVSSRRAEIEAKIEVQRRLRGASVLDGTPFDETSLRQAEGELDALDDADGESSRRAARALDAAQVAQRAEDKKLFLSASTNWLAKIEEAEAMARAMVSALGAAEEQRGEVQRLVLALTGSRPMTLIANVQADRRSKSLGALLNSFTGDGRFGDMRLPMFICGAGDPWASEERTTIASVEKELAGGGNG